MRPLLTQQNFHMVHENWYTVGLCFLPTAPAFSVCSCLQGWWVSIPFGEEMLQMLGLPAESVTPNLAFLSIPPFFSPSVILCISLCTTDSELPELVSHPPPFFCLWCTFQRTLRTLAAVALMLLHTNVRAVLMSACVSEAHWDSGDPLKRIPAWGHFTWLFQIHTNKALYSLKVAPQNGCYRAPWKAQHDCHGYYTTQATTGWGDKCWSGTKLEQTFLWGGPGNVDRPVNGLFNPLKVNGGSLKQMHSDRLCTHWDTKSTLSPCKRTRQKARDENKIGKVGMCLRQIPSAQLFYFLASTLPFWAQQRDDLSHDWALASILTEPI